MSVFGGRNEETPSLQSESASEEIPPSSPHDESIVQQGISLENFDFDSGSNWSNDADFDERKLKKRLTEKEIKAYRGWHIQETNLIDAFEIARSGDLGRNLLGFAAERRLNLSKHPAKIVASWASRNRWTDNQESRDALPPPWWTAWPLLPDEVPLAHERFHGSGTDENYNRTAKRQKTSHPSAEFEEALCDFAVSKARDRFNRALEPESSSDLILEEEESGTSLKQEYRHDSSSESIRTDKAGIISPIDEVSTLSFSADQDRTRDIVRPTVRSIMSKFDTLMTGLYRSRVNHRAHRSSSHDAGVESLRPRSSSSTEGEKRDALGLRDWSEVLGMASLTGWDPAVVARAAQRCTKIFGEGMSFVELEAETPIKLSAYTPDLVPELEGEDQWTLDTLICPHEGCSRHTRGFDLKRRLRWHIKDVHDWDPDVERRPPKMFGGVHLDGFMRQIPAQPGWRSKDKSISRKRGSTRKKETGHDIDIAPAENIRAVIDE